MAHPAPKTSPELTKALTILMKTTSKRVPRPAGDALTKAESLILAALVQHPLGRSKTQVAVMTGYAVTSGAFGQALSALREAGLMDGTRRLTITAHGIEILWARPRRTE